MGKGKKRGLKGLVLLSIVVILIVCCFTLAACGKTTDEKNSGTNIEQSEGQGNNSGNQSEIEQGGQETGGQTGGEVTPNHKKKLYINPIKHTTHPINHINFWLLSAKIDLQSYH